ncbi:MAG: YraN family protein [Clostridia bacterium]|nr:YraN family protein [Clostridia bacterium]
MKNTKAVGNIGEQIAAEYLENKGYTVLERNAVYGGCEVDIISECFVGINGEIMSRAKSGNGSSSFFSKLVKCKKEGNRVIVFCEVKTRYGEEYGSGLEAVTPYKMGRYITAAKSYCMQKHLTNEDVRFDVIEVSDKEVLHIENAFTENDARYPKNLH